MSGYMQLSELNNYLSRWRHDDSVVRGVDKKDHIKKKIYQEDRMEEPKQKKHKYLDYS